MSMGSGGRAGKPAYWVLKNRHQRAGRVGKAKTVLLQALGEGLRKLEKRRLAGELGPPVRSPLAELPADEAAALRWKLELREAVHRLSVLRAQVEAQVQLEEARGRAA